MARTISQYQVAPFITPQNGQPGDADQVRGNDNTVRVSINSHDGDSGVHFQSSVLASRPVAGVAGRKWLTEDTRRLYYDDGSTWQEADYLTNGAASTTYLPLAGGTLTGVLNVDAVGGIAAASTINLKAGTGSVVFTTNSTIRWTVDNTGHLRPGGSGVYDLGTAILPVRDVYAGTLQVGGQRVVGARVTGYAPFTGTVNRGSALDTSTVTLAQLAGRVWGLQQDLTTHGLIGS